MFMMLRRAPTDMVIASSPLIVERLTSVTTSPFSTWKELAAVVVDLFAELDPRQSGLSERSVIAGRAAGDRALM